MKRLLLILAAALVITGANADPVLHESFERNAGTLNKGANTAMGENTTDWWSFSGTSNYIQVIEGSL